MSSNLGPSTWQEWYASELHKRNIVKSYDKNWMTQKTLVKRPLHRTRAVVTATLGWWKEKHA